jgi:hypothetical protein
MNIQHQSIDAAKKSLVETIDVEEILCTVSENEQL